MGWRAARAGRHVVVSRARRGRAGKGSRRGPVRAGGLPGSSAPRAARCRSGSSVAGSRPTDEATATPHRPASAGGFDTRRAPRGPLAAERTAARVRVARVARAPAPRHAGPPRSPGAPGRPHPARRPSRGVPRRPVHGFDCAVTPGLAPGNLRRRVRRGPPRSLAIAWSSHRATAVAASRPVGGRRPPGRAPPRRARAAPHVALPYSTPVERVVGRGRPERGRSGCGRSRWPPAAPRARPGPAASARVGKPTSRRSRPRRGPSRLGSGSGRRRLDGRHVRSRGAGRARGRRAPPLAHVATHGPVRVVPILTLVTLRHSYTLPNPTRNRPTLPQTPTVAA